uniref:Uncharacterized protein n=1 Tax=Anopheles quadriannulatus TaxID=34691 RepID=A0A182XTL9_ANOQN
MCVCVYVKFSHVSECVYV